MRAYDDYRGIATQRPHACTEGRQDVRCRAVAPRPLSGRTSDLLSCGCSKCHAAASPSKNLAMVKRKSCRSAILRRDIPSQPTPSVPARGAWILDPLTSSGPSVRAEQLGDDCIRCRCLHVLRHQIGTMNCWPVRAQVVVSANRKSGACGSTLYGALTHHPPRRSNPLVFLGYFASTNPRVARAYVRFASLSNVL